MTLVARLGGSERFGLRFLCFAWLAGSLAILRAVSAAASSSGSDGAGGAILLLLSTAAAFGVGLLWRTRESGLTELVESCAALGFWSGVFALAA